MTLEEEKRFLLLLGSYYCLTNGIQTTKKNVLDTIDNNGWVNLNSNDLMIKNNRNELVWRNDFACVRKHLAQENFFLDRVKNDWRIIDPTGKAELKRLFSIANNSATLNKITAVATQYGNICYPFP